MTAAFVRVNRKTLTLSILLAALVVLAPLGAQQSPQDAIRLKSGVVAPKAMAPAELNTLSATALSPHCLVQFRSLPTVAERKALEASGVKLLSYVSANTYWAAVETGRARLGDVAAGGGIRWAQSASAIDTVSAQLRSGKIPGTALLDDGRIAVHVAIFADTELAEAAQAITRAGASVLGNLGVSSLIVAATPEAIARIGLLDIVEWVEPAYGSKPSNATATGRAFASELPFPPYELTGTGIKVGIWEAGDPHHVFPHQDFAERLEWDVEETSYSDHATHVAGTIGGSGLGDPLAAGFAPGVSMKSLGLGQDLGITTMRQEAAAGNIQIANHSHNAPAGYELVLLDPVSGTFGYVDQGMEGFGQYDVAAQEWDRTVLETDMPIINSAGDNRDDGPEGEPGDGGASGYDTIPTYASAKNIITVGAHNDVDGLTAYSGFGPTDDGRVKPDILANGQTVYSTIRNNGYEEMTGTSMACAAVSGASALIYEQFRKSNGGDVNLPASMLKALLVNGALDKGSRGPDYVYGHGLMNATSSVRFVQLGQYRQGVYDGTTPVAYPLSFSGAKWVKATLAWTDPPGSPAAEPILQNDLNLIVRDPDGTVYQPFVLNPASPGTRASTGTNTLDNVEQIAFFGFGAGWTLEVSGTLAVGTEQSFSVVCEGLAPELPFTQKLQVQSEGASNVLVSVSPADVNGQVDGITSFTRFYEFGTEVTLTAETEIPERRFLGWETVTREGTEEFTDPILTLMMETDYTAIASYISAPNVLVSEEDDYYIIEGREPRTFGITLSTQPPSTAVVDITSIGDPDLVLESPAQLTFTVDDWNVEQFITIRALHDFDDIDGVATFIFTGDVVLESRHDFFELDDDVNGFNDNFYNRRLIETMAGSDYTNTILYTQQEGEPIIFCEDYNAFRPGGRSAWWQWVPPVTGPAHINTRGSNFNTIMGLYAGTDLDNLQWIAGNDDGGGADRTSAISFNAQAGQPYLIQTDGFLAKAGTLHLNWIQVNPITIFAPNGGEQFRPGQQTPIHWAAHEGMAGNRVKIYLYKGETFYYSITGGTDNDGVYLWDVPADLEPGDDYRITITSFDKVYRDYSDSFFSVSEPTPVRVVWPNGGEHFIAGQPYRVYWDAPEDEIGDRVKVYLYKGDAYVLSISGGTSNDGSHPWTIPADLEPGDDYRITVMPEDKSTRDYSDRPFAISAPDGMAFNIVTPNGWQDLKIGEPYIVRWNSFGQGASDVKLYLYYYGQYVKTITGGTDNDGEYEWTPDEDIAPGLFYTIAVMNADNKSIRDYSDMFFSISE